MGLVGGNGYGIVKEIVAVEVGVTNARLARARLEANGTPSLGKVRKYKVADQVSLAATWAAFARDEANEGSGDLPGSACIAFATAMQRDVVKLTTSRWSLRPDMLAGELGLAELRLINDFEEIGRQTCRVNERQSVKLSGVA